MAMKKAASYDAAFFLAAPLGLAAGRFIHPVGRRAAAAACAMRVDGRRRRGRRLPAQQHRLIVGFALCGALALWAGQRRIPFGHRAPAFKQAAAFAGIFIERHRRYLTSISPARHGAQSAPGRFCPATDRRRSATGRAAAPVSLSPAPGGPRTT